MTLPIWYSRLLIGGESGTDVDVVNRKLGVMDPTYGEASVQHVRGLQKVHELPVTGIVDSDTAMVLGEAADHQIPPCWFRRPLGLGVEGEDVAALRSRLGVREGTLFDLELERAVRRFQSAHRLPLTGNVDESLALLLP